MADVVPNRRSGRVKKLRPNRRVDQAQPAHPGSSTRTVTPPAVEVSFGAAQYEVVEGEGVEITVELNKNPERRVSVPLTITHEGGASQDDYDRCA